MTRPAPLGVSDYVQGILAANRVILGRAFTLLESTRASHQTLARKVLAQCQPYAGRALRVAVTGAPGVGKSSLIERLGCYLIDQGNRVAVLATDPTSVRTGGSILGDKTRMPVLTSHKHAFVRPSPSGGALGGVTHATRQAMTLCEAARFDIILVETVGVGQSEVTVRDLVDVVLLLVLAQAGDGLQAVKRGIMETADIIAVAKADGEAVTAARSARHQYQRSLRLYPVGPSGIRTRVLTCSAITGEGIAKIWETTEAYRKTAESNGYFLRNRTHQARLNVTRTVAQALQSDFVAHPAVAAELSAVQDTVIRGEKNLWEGVQSLLNLYRTTDRTDTSQA